MAKRLVARPPIVRQGVGFKCWAAVLESWLAITPGRQLWNMNQLLEYAMRLRSGFDGNIDPKTRKFEPLPPGAINARIFKELINDQFLNLLMGYEEIPRGTGLADNDLYQRMAWYRGHLYVVYTPGNQIVTDIRHANVVWMADDEGNLGVMDPQAGAIMNQRSDHFGSPLLIAWKEPTSSTLG